MVRMHLYSSIFSMRVCSVHSSVLADGHTWLGTRVSPIVSVCLCDGVCMCLHLLLEPGGMS